MTSLEPIELIRWLKDPARPGYVVSGGRRPICEIAAELESALTRSGCSFEYLSHTGRYETFTREANPDKRWPDGTTFIALEHGGNEGYSLSVYVRSDVSDAAGVFTLQRPIRVKLLCSLADALATYALVFPILTD